MSKKNKQQNLSPENYIKQRSRNLPIKNCWVNEGWEEGGMSEVIVTRKHSNGNTTYCAYLMDLLCLGVKDTAYNFNIPIDEFEEFLETLNSKMPMMDISYTLAHNIIFAGLEYAEELGFKPHKDFTLVTKYFLEEDTEAIELIDIECGRDGKPIYVKGQYDTHARAKEILHQLSKSQGQDGYHYIVPADLEDSGNSYSNNYEEISFEENKYTFMQLAEKDPEGNSEEELESLFELTNTLYGEIIQEETLKLFDERWAAELEMEIAEKTYTHEMLGLNETVIITDEDVELLNSISVNNDDGWESLESLRNKWGDFAYADFVFLQYFTEVNSDNFQEQLSKAIKLYPGNAIIRMEQYAQILLSEPDSCTEIIFEEFFKGRNEITGYEMFKFQTIKLSYFSHHKDLSALEAMYYQLEDILDTESGYFKMLISSLILVRMRLLKEGFLKNLV